MTQRSKTATQRVELDVVTLRAAGHISFRPNPHFSQLYQLYTGLNCTPGSSEHEANMRFAGSFLMHDPPDISEADKQATKQNQQAPVSFHARECLLNPTLQSDSAVDRIRYSFEKVIQ